MLKLVVRQVPLKMTPNFQRQHYLYWCNVYNLSQGNQAVFPNTTIRVRVQRYEKNFYRCTEKIDFFCNYFFVDYIIYTTHRKG